MLKIVLASQSPRRKKLLSQLELDFEIIPSTSEEIITSDNPEQVVTDLAFQKAEEVAKKLFRIVGNWRRHYCCIQR